VAWERRTIADLRLNLEAAREGRTWLLLPEGFRDQESGTTYPLPTSAEDLQQLAAIYIPGSKKDCGCLYLHRAFRKWKERAGRRVSAVNDVRRRVHQIQEAHSDFRGTLNQLQKEAKEAVSTVQAQAEQAIASLDTLFSLGRKGIGGQMEAHISGQSWQGEMINARAFRQCFQMVTQAVKGLGLPTGERTAAGKAIVDELAASLAATKDALSQAGDAPTLAPAPDKKETEH
jgi:hypothetical protein